MSNRRFAWIGVFSFLLAGIPQAAEALSSDEKIEQLERLIRAQQELLDEQHQQMQELRDRIQTLEKEPGRQTAPPPPSKPVDLTPEESPSLIPAPPAASGGAGPARMADWSRKLDLSGFGAAGLAATGHDAERADLGFLIYDAELLLNFNVWEKTDFFLELITTERGSDAETKSGETYLHLHSLFEETFPDGLGLKIGRIDIPFGEAYRHKDSVDNPLITDSANLPYNWDEGIVAYGQWGKLGWVGAVMDGQATRSVDDTSDKAVILKLYGEPAPPLFLSASFLRNGKSSKSALRFAGSHFQPVGRAGGSASALGTSPSTQIRSYAYVLDARYSWDPRRRISLSFGQGFVEDDDSVFDRDFLFFTAEPFWQIADKWYVVSRVSGIGTYDGGEGYHFDGNPFAGGISDFGDNAKSLFRWAIGLGYQLNPRTTIKLEYSRDDFEVIDASTLDDSHEKRDFVGAQVVVGF